MITVWFLLFRSGGSDKQEHGVQSDFQVRSGGAVVLSHGSAS